jgi:hypothetical protein
MKKELCTILVATQLIGVWLAGAQTNLSPAEKHQSSAIEANASLVTLISTNPAIVVSPRRLDFGVVRVGSSSNLTLTVQNVGSGVLVGCASSLPPFFIDEGGCYSLGSLQSQMLVVRYMPTAQGTNIQTVALSGGGDATITVSGCGAAKPAPPMHLRIVAQ